MNLLIIAFIASNLLWLYAWSELRKERDANETTGKSVMDSVIRQGGTMGDLQRTLLVRVEAGVASDYELGMLKSLTAAIGSGGAR